MANWPRRNRAVSIDYDVAIPMRDGIRLQADVFRPAGDGRLPVVLLRTPYDRQLGSTFGLQLNAVQLAAAGYAVVVQDTRGRFGSDGDFSPFVHEGRDGDDSIAWCAEQPWSNGRVGMAGSSYLGFTQVLTAKEQPEALKAWVPALTTIDARTAWVYEDGAFCLGFDLSWALLMMSGDPRTRDLAAVHDALRLWPETVQTPIEQNPIFDQPSGQFLRDWIERKNDDDYWAARSGFGVERCSAPALQIGGWYDLFLTGPSGCTTRWLVVRRRRAPFRDRTVGSFGYPLARIGQCRFRPARNLRPQRAQPIGSIGSCARNRNRTGRRTSCSSPVRIDGMFDVWPPRAGGRIPSRSRWSLDRYGRPRR